ncbi:MAG: hypothetical protein N2A99_06415 [Carnobacterium alterfunditum]
MEKMPAILLGLLAVIIFCGIIIFDKLVPEIDKQENDVMNEMKL